METTTLKPMKTDALSIGIGEEHREKIARGLSAVLADTYMLYLKTHNYHWNVTGPMFHTLHLQFEEHYTEMAAAIDLIAERIRSIGYRAPGSFREFVQLTAIKEDEDTPDAPTMIRRLVQDHETVMRSARSVVEVCAEASDEASLDLMTERLTVHSKTAWMLRSQM